MRALVACLVIVAASPARADDPQPRKEDASLGEIFHGPFQSSRLFAMPVADTVGAYMFTMSGDGSLLQQPGVLTSAAVLAIGFGDIAQLDYRHTAAISITGVAAPVPAIGGQLKLPLPEGPNVPAIGVAIRYGVERDEQVATTTLAESVTDVYLVARERFAAVPWLTLHGGVRYSPAKVVVTDPTAMAATIKRNMWLPAGGFELAVNDKSRVVGEAQLVPQFQFENNTAAIATGAQARLGLRWALFPWATFDASFGYQLDETMGTNASPRDVVQQWDIRLGAEIFVPWGALACRAAGAFCD